MKEEELLLFKEEVDKIKESRNVLLVLGAGIFLLCVIVSRFQSIDLVVSGTIGIICCIVASLKYDRDYENELKELKKHLHSKKLVNIHHMSNIVCNMIDDALIAFETNDVSKFNDFVEREDTADKFRYSIFRECISYMMEDPKVIERCSHYMMVARYLERCADHACKMAEKIYYMVTGERVEIDCREETSKACFTNAKKEK